MAKKDKKESPAEKRLKKEKELNKLNSLGLRDARKSFLLKEKDKYGTSLSKGAEYAGKEAYKKAYKKVEKEEPLVFEEKPGGVKVRLKTEGEKGAAGLAASRKAEREAASEERREMRGVEKDSKKKQMMGGGMMDKNKMGMSAMDKGGAVKKYAKGGMGTAKCGASNPASGKTSKK
jgi:hypothetical protein